MFVSGFLFTLGAVCALFVLWIAIEILSCL